jgi:PGF-CTERM protein
MSRSRVSLVTLAVVVAFVAPGAIGTVAAQDVTLDITMVDQDGDPVGNVDFTVTWNESEGGPENYSTSASGRRLVDVPEGADVSIGITDDQYIRNSPYTIPNASGQAVEISVARSGQATITVQGPNGPVANADVTVRKGFSDIDSTTTDADGTATTTRIEQGTYNFRVYKSGFLTNATEIFVSGQTDRTIQLERGSVEARFTVVDDHFDDPRPLENATVTIPQLGTTLSTFGDGTRTASVPVNNRFEVTVDKDGYGSETRTLIVREEAASLDLSIQRVPAMTIETDQDRNLVGESTTLTATNEYGEPVAGATVSVDGETVGQTNDAGQLDVPIERTGDITIEVSGQSRSGSVTVQGVEPATEPTGTAAPTDTPTPTDTATPTDSPTETDGDSGAGFGIVVALAALAGGLFLLRRR